MVKLSYRQQKLEKVMDQEGLADEEVSAHPVHAVSSVQRCCCQLDRGVKPFQVSCGQLLVSPMLCMKLWSCDVYTVVHADLRRSVCAVPSMQGKRQSFCVSSVPGLA